MYKTPQERIEAFLDFCSPQRCTTCVLNKFKKRQGIADCAFFWLEQEAAELIKCPFCDNELIMFSVDDKLKYAFLCPNPTCHFMSPIFTKGDKKQKLINVLKSMAKTRKENSYDEW